MNILLSAILTALFFITQVGDWYTTEKILGKGGVETNPVMKALFKIIPYQIALPLKAIFGSVLIYFISKISYGIYIDCTLILFYAWVVYHNFKQCK